MRTLAVCGVLIFIVLIQIPALAGSRMAVIPNSAQPVTATSVIRGVVTDDAGLPVAGAAVRLSSPDGSRDTTTSVQGAFVFTGLSVGSYFVTVAKDGYSSEFSTTIYVTEVSTTEVNVKLQNHTANVMGRVTVSATRGVQTSPVIYNVVPRAQFDRIASFRLFDTIASMPQINPGQYNSAAPGDNASVNIRGIGWLETVTLIDGHPATVANSGCGCFEYNNAPTMSLKAVDVTYGSGAVGLYGVNAIAGVVDLQTIDPTVRPESTLSLGIGSYADAIWDVRTTGTDQKLGYAFNYGAHTSDGSLFHERIYNPSTSVDPTNPANIPAATYAVDMGYMSRSALQKLRYSFTPQTVLTITALNSDTWDDKTGNGDNDYNPYDTALANAENSASNANPPCVVGQVNINGNCYTPQQAASFFAGPQGGGPADQSFRLSDYHGNFRTTHGHATYSIDFYHGFYVRNYNRFFQLPGPNPFWFTEGTQQTGVQLSEDIQAGNNDLGFGYYIQHLQAARTHDGVPQGSPYVNDGNIFARDIISAGHLTTYLNAWFKRSSLTNTSHFDPRVTLVYHPNTDNVFRLTSGGGITQPNPTDRFASFSGTGAINPNCGGLTSIGSGPGVNEVPETSSDLEVSYGHQSRSGSTVQLTAYRTNLYNQLFSTSADVAALGAGYVPPDLLTAIFQRIQLVCPGFTPTINDLSVSITENLGHSQYKGLELTGSQRLTQQLRADYSYGIQSAVPVSLDQNLYMRSPNLIIGSQLPFIPIHKAMLGLDYSRSGWDAYMEGFMTDENNGLLLPRYYYANGSLSKTINNTKLTLSVRNMFNSWADSYGYFGHGYLPTNQFNPQSPNVLLDGYEQFHLPYRRYFFTLTTRVAGG